MSVWGAGGRNSGGSRTGRLPSSYLAQHSRHALNSENMREAVPQDEIPPLAVGRPRPAAGCGASRPRRALSGPPPRRRDRGRGKARGIEVRTGRPRKQRDRAGGDPATGIRTLGARVEQHRVGRLERLRSAPGGLSRKSSARELASRRRDAPAGVVLKVDAPLFERVGLTAHARRRTGVMERWALPTAAVAPGVEAPPGKSLPHGGDSTLQAHRRSG